MTVHTSKFERVACWSASALSVVPTFRSIRASPGKRSLRSADRRMLAGCYLYHAGQCFQTIIEILSVQFAFHLVE